MPTQALNVVPDWDLTLSQAGKVVRNVHGSAYVSPYLVGSSRVVFADGNGNPTSNLFVRVHKDDPNSYVVANVYPEGSTNFWAGCDALVVSRGKVWACLTGGNAPVEAALYEIDPVAWTFTPRATWSSAPSGGNEVIVADGTTLYFNIGTRIYRYQLDTGAVSSFDLVLAATFNTPHAAVVDDAFLYLSRTSGGSACYLEKYNKSTGAFVARVAIPQATDDMDQDDTWLYLGEEVADSAALGYGWGAFAVRKSDLALRSLPALSGTDGVSVRSYSSLARGNYLVDCKTNDRLYLVDRADPASWNQASDMSALTVADVSFVGGTSSAPNNELLIDENGRLYSFRWASPSRVRAFNIPGFSLASRPTVATQAPLTAAGVVTLRADLAATGGAAIQEAGFYLDTVNPPAEKAAVAGVAAVGAFSLDPADLQVGVAYYARAFARNAVGEALGVVYHIKRASYRLLSKRGGQETPSNTTTVAVASQV